MESVAVLEKPKSRKIPSGLIHEVLNGKNLYYRNYKKVISGEETLEGVMGSSSLQSALVYVLGLFLGLKINRKQYRIVTSEAGVKLDKTRLSIDLAIYDKNIPLDTKYFQKAPKIAIEVDVKIELKNDYLDEIEYVLEKSDKLIEYNTEKVIWILTKNQKIVVTQAGEIGKIYKWNQEVEILDGVMLNLAQLLEEEEISY